MFLALSAVAALATHGGSIIDLTADGALEEHNDAIFTQGGFGSGTGNFDPFLTLQPGGNVDTEFGFNLCSEPVFGFTNASITCPSPNMENQGGDRTHELRASSVPAIDVDGTLYREFFLDSNDTGADPWMSVQVIRIFLDEQPDLTYNPVTNAFTGNTGTAPSLLWDLDGDGDQTILTNTQGLESGSGVSDMSVLVPDSLFPPNCYYGSTTCNLFIYFGTIAGDPELEVAGHDGKNWNTTAGFEEWSTELLPVVDVEKTVDISLERTYPWDVQKEADGEPDVINLFAGDTSTINWTVTATVGTPTDSDASITGDIVITNPTGGAIPEIEAVVEDVEDVLTLGGVAVDATVTCPEEFPFSIDGGDSVTCTYSHDPSDTDDGTNEATVTLGLYEQNDLVDTVEYSDTENVLFADADVTEIDECVEVTDDNATPANTADDELLDAELCANESPGVYPDSNTVGPFTVDTCGSTTVTNTAYTETNDTGTVDSDPDSVTVNCYELAVAKTVEESLTRTWEWDLEKSSDVETIELFAGDTATIEWTVTLIGLGSTDSTWHVEGDITITNPAPMVAEDVAVTDVISGFAGTIEIDCSPDAGLQPTVDVPAAAGGVDGTATCSYAADLPAGGDRTNTATATLFGIGYDSDAEAIDFTGASVTEVDECITVTDDNATPGDTSDDFTFTPDPVCVTGLEGGQYEFPPFTTDVGPFTVDTCGSIVVENTASSVTNDDEVTDEASADVDVNCYELTVEKDASTSLDRDYNWDILKTRVFATNEDDGDLDPTTLTLDPNQTYTLTYEIEVDLEATPFVDANWAVAGTITVTNPAPIIAEDVVIIDEISGGVGAPDNLDCDPAAGEQTTVDIPANGSVECSYSSALPDGTNRTNTATATLFAIDYWDSADVDFSTADISEIDECITVVDDNGTPLDPLDDVTLGTVCADDPLPHTFTHEITVGPFEACGVFEFTNTASFTTVDDDNDTDESGSSPYTVIIDVPCPEGCTLTLGYWKTHNATFWGGASDDPNWFLIGDVDGDGISEGENEDFFDIPNTTWFDVFWTNVAGRPYYQLAHQWMAAYLNALSIQDLGGTIPAEVQGALDDGAALLDEYDGSEVGKSPDLKGRAARDIRAEFVGLAGILGDFNEGDIGPGHCDDDGTEEG